MRSDTIGVLLCRCYFFMKITLATLLAQSIAAGNAARLETASLDAEVLMAHILKQDRVYCLSHPEKVLSAAQVAAFTKLWKQRVTKRVPVAYLVGRKAFYGMDFFVETKQCLIPRPETEELVDLVLEQVKKHPTRLPIVEVGTGSGCIALSLAKCLPATPPVVATDISMKALSLAKKNARVLGLTKRVKFVKASFFPKDLKQTDLVVANLPYLSEKEYTIAVKKYPELQHEPKSALVSGAAGLDAIEMLLRRASKILTPEGCIMLEIGFAQGKKVTALAKKYFPKKECTIVRDGCNFDRFAVIR